MSAKTGVCDLVFGTLPLEPMPLHATMETVLPRLLSFILDVKPKSDRLGSLMSTECFHKGRLSSELLQIAICVVFVNWLGPLSTRNLTGKPSLVPD